MIIGVGVDIVKLRRIEDLYKKHGVRFLEKVLSEDEIKLIPEKFAALYIGGRFAAKEALVKALGGRDFDFSEISLLNDENGRPFVSEKEKISDILRAPAEIHVSISHEQDYCAALAVIEKKP